MRFSSKSAMPQPRSLKTPLSPISWPMAKTVKALDQSRPQALAKRKPPGREGPQWLSSHWFSARRLCSHVCDHSFQPDVAVLHAFVHTAREHHGASLLIGQRHAHCHQGAGAIWNKSGFNTILRSRIWQKHAFHVDDFAVRPDFDEFAGDVESAFIRVFPFVAEFAADPRLVDANRHSPVFGTEQPLLDDLRLHMSAVDGFRRSCKMTGDDDVGIAFGLHRQFTHRNFLSVSLVDCMAARTPSSRS